MTPNGLQREETLANLLADSGHEELFTQAFSHAARNMRDDIENRFSVYNQPNRMRGLMWKSTSTKYGVPKRVEKFMGILLVLKMCTVDDRLWSNVQARRGSADARKG